MKNLNKFGIILLTLVSTALTSCSKDSSSNGGGSGSISGKITATIGDSGNFSSLTQGTTAMLLNNGSYQNLAIQGSEVSGKSIQLEIIGNNIVAGTYPITVDNADYNVSAVYSELNVSNPIDSATYSSPYSGGTNLGSVTITSITATNVKGTFSFTGEDNPGVTKVISNGKFDVNISTN